MTSEGRAASFAGVAAVAILLVALACGEEEATDPLTSSQSASHTPSASIAPSESPPIPSTSNSSSPFPTIPPVAAPPIAASPAGLTLTYVDPTYGYSFQYPGNWFLGQANVGGYGSVQSIDPKVAKPIEGIPAGELKVEFRVAANSEALPLDAWIAKNITDNVLLRQSLAPVDGVTGIQREVSLPAVGNVLATQYFFEKGAYVYVVVATPSDSPLISTVPAILATFKFNK